VDLELSDKIVVVTGASKGIGLAIVGVVAEGAGNACLSIFQP
jgi:NAD(P)-dependent dehydrogenase (short-subunit alcohol dehydrogenase family)